MRIVRLLLSGGLLCVALMSVAAGAVQAAPGQSAKGVVTFTQLTDDPPLEAGEEYTLSYNASGSSAKASGGFTLSGDDIFLGGKTIAFCDSTGIIFEVNPPKKGSPDLADYLVIRADGTIVDVVPPGGQTPTC